MTATHKNDLVIDEKLVHQLVSSQFPQWKNLPIRLVETSGWDNKSFRLGEQMLVRLPSAKEYASQVEKEQKWLPKLGPFLPLSIPNPLVMGKPECGYPWFWSVYHWLDGVTAASGPIDNLNDFAMSLAKFLVALQRVDPTGGPLAGEQNFYRGGELSVYDVETRKAISILDSKIDKKRVTEVWEQGLTSTWSCKPIWVHGDISAGNLLVKNGVLSAVIDFGQLGVGDPACDLMIAWTMFSGKSREVFCDYLPLDEKTWVRGRAWALWKSLNYIVNNKTDMNFEAKRSWQIIEEIIADFKWRGC